MTPIQMQEFLKKYKEKSLYITDTTVVKDLKEIGEDSMADRMSLQKHLQIWDLINIVDAAATLFTDEVIFNGHQQSH